MWSRWCRPGRFGVSGAYLQPEGNHVSVDAALQRPQDDEHDGTQDGLNHGPEDSYASTPCEGGRRGRIGEPFHSEHGFRSTHQDHPGDTDDNADPQGRRGDLRVDG